MNDTLSPPTSPSVARSSSPSTDTPRTSYSDGRYLQESDLLDEPDGASDDGSTSSMPKRGKLHNVTLKTKAKAKKLLHIKSDDPGTSVAIVAQDGPLKNIEDDPAFNPSKLGKKKHRGLRGTADKTLDTLQSVATSAIHPRKSTKSKVTRTTAGQLSKIERPFLSQKADLKLLDAHDDLGRVESSKSSRHPSSNDETDSLAGDLRDRVEALEAHRESLRVAWMTSHIDRVRVVPKRHLNFPNKEAFVDRDGQGMVVRYQWEKWLGYFLLYYTQDFSAQYIDDFDELPFDLDTLRKHVERLVMASEPWQSWAFDVRSVYRWEDPVKTGKWLALYLVLWYTQNVVGFLWAYILYLVIKNRYFPTSVDSLRESTRRTRDRERASTRLGELIDKYGQEQWLEPLIDELGPHIQLQLGDVANLLEVFINFYAWKAPRQTFSSLCFFTACLLLSLFADMAFCMKVFWFIAGGGFFLCWPISSRYPKYRYLVSPFKWVLWDIPTHSEWSFQYLRRQAQISREEMVKRKVEESHAREILSPASSGYVGQINVPQVIAEGYVTDDDDDEDWHSVTSSKSVLEETDIMSFRTYWKGTAGRLVIYSAGIRFVRSLVRKELWKRSFLELAEMRKLQGSTMLKLTKISPDHLEFKCTDGSILHMEAMKDRDEAFNSIIGFSNLQWQSLQAGPGK